MDFIDVEILGTIAGCSAIVTVLTQVTKRYLPDTVNTKWLALLYSVIIGIARIVYIGQFDFAGIASGIINIFILLSVAVGIYEIASDTIKFSLTPTSTTTETDDTTITEETGGDDSNGE